ncbi:MAG: COG3014 family protein [Cyclobacteriaceae bacterium]
MFRLGSAKVVVLFSLLIGQGCATYYQTNYSFNESFERGNLEAALKALQESSSRDYRKTEFLYLVNNGLLLSVLGRYEESNEYLEKAFIFGEDFRINYLNEAASYLTNPTITNYRGEDHEHLMVLYYKAMNFLKMGKNSEALVECRRLNIRLQQLSDRYQSDKKFQRDAFIHLLMGIIYEADNDFNNAFIAYRNAYEIYQADYQQLFNESAPPQLKTDILRTALLSGLQSEFEQFKTEFDMLDYQYEPTEGGDLVFFWHNGLTPVKAEWSINFVVNRNGNTVTFVNEEFGFSFPFNIGDYDEEDKSGLAALEVFRVAFPKYVERPVYFGSASIETDQTTIELQQVEDVNKIAQQVLSQRMTLEFSKALLRAALKKATEYQMRKENKALGSLFGIINALTEKADTRNWQTLPHSIYYSRVPLKLGTNEVTLKLQPAMDKPVEPHTFTYVIDKKGMIFHTFTSLETRYPSYNLY